MVRGKDPLGAVLIALEFVGPCRFAGWAAEDMPELGLLRGDPVAKSNPQAWVQTAAVSLTQSQNVMAIFQTLFTEECKQTHMIDVGKEVVYAYGGQRKIQSVTSSPRTLEGNRPSFVLMNEALALDTPIPTPSGWTMMGDLKDGDLIYGSDGTPTRVTKAHPTQEGRECFRVTFDDGNSVVASDGHWWKVRVAANRRCSLRQMTTEQMFQHDGDLYLPESFDSLETGDDIDLPIDPYFLGLWLGDGDSRSSLIATDEQDAEELLGFLREIEPNAHMRDRNHIAMSQGSTRKPGSMQERLRREGLILNKHIPDAYLRASFEQRLALLRGLMDSDGSVRRGGVARFANTDRALLAQVEELLVSLGYHVKRAKFQTRTGERAHWAPLGQVSFKAVESVNPFRLSRKSSQVQGERSPTRTRLRRIVNIERVESVPVRCISVSAEDKLFLAGRGMHATRNTHHWVGNNKGREMAKVIRRNLAKSKGGQARALSITNAYERGEESVAEVRRTTYEAAIERGRTPEQIGVLYDSVEAPGDAYLAPPPQRNPGGEIVRRPTEVEIKAYIGAIVDTVRGDAIWLDVDRIVGEVLDGETTTEESRRFYYNQIGAEEDAWLDPLAIERAIDKNVAEHVAASGMSRFDDRWITVQDEPVVMFFDGSKSMDATGLVGCRLSDGHVFTIGVWQRPAGERGQTWRAPREAVDSRVREAMARFNVVAFWADPSHAKDDEDGSHYWDAIIDEWHQDFRDRFDKSVWAVKSAERTHSIMWDMTSPMRSELFVQAAARFVEEMERKNDIEEIEPSFTIDGHPMLLSHLRNARRRMTKWGESLGKPGRQSTKKIDLAVCAVGARMLRRVVLNVKPEEEAEQPAGFWSY